jgi:hypothetical protein
MRLIADAQIKTDRLGAFANQEPAQGSIKE